MIEERWFALGKASDYANLDGVDFREYQFNIIRSIFSGKNTLVILPTGLGKTLIGVFAMAKAIADGKKAMFLSPTKPLSEQHYETLKRSLKINDGGMALLTGALGTKKRKVAEDSAQVMVATPQTVMNDMKKGSLSLDDFGVIVFDECHRAVGKYAYTYVANEAWLKGTQILGLTASPGSKKEKIEDLLATLHINRIEIRASTDPDVAGYVMAKEMRVISVQKSHRIEEAADLLKPLIEENMSVLKKLGLMPFKRFESMPKGSLIGIGDEIRKLQAPNYRFAAMAAYIKLLNLTHAYDMLETEGFYPFSSYLHSLYAKEKKSKALESLLRNEGFGKAKRIIDSAIEKGEEHPKVTELIGLLNARKGRKAIVFAQYRSTITMLVKKLVDSGLNARAFVGKRDGVTQEAQKQTIEDFRRGAFDVLVSTSIGEEGLDIPNVDTVIFYEPISSEIRNIQRKGRTGRHYSGEVIFMMARGTKDEIYFFMSKRKEAKMMRTVENVKRELDKENRLERSLSAGQHRLL
jgi:Fanconi anemia group M protein